MTQSRCDYFPSPSGAREGLSVSNHSYKGAKCPEYLPSLTQDTASNLDFTEATCSAKLCWVEHNLDCSAVSAGALLAIARTNDGRTLTTSHDSQRLARLGDGPSQLASDNWHPDSFMDEGQTPMCSLTPATTLRCLLWPVTP
eukprot:5956441-Prymnesium_polylepis.2